MLMHVSTAEHVKDASPPAMSKEVYIA